MMMNCGKAIYREPRAQEKERKCEVSRKDSILKQVVPIIQDLGGLNAPGQRI